MPRPKNLSKQNPKLLQKTLQDGRASLYLEYYLGRHETPVLDENGNPVLYTEGAMAGKPKYKITHNRKKESLNLYLWLNPRNQQERLQNRNTLSLAEKIRFEREQEFLEDREGYRLQKEKEPNFHDFIRKIYSEEATITKSAKYAFRLIHNRFIKYLNSIPSFRDMRHSSGLRMYPTKSPSVSPNGLKGYAPERERVNRSSISRKHVRWR